MAPRYMLLIGDDDYYGSTPSEVLAEFARNAWNAGAIADMPAELELTAVEAAKLLLAQRLFLRRGIDLDADLPDDEFLMGVAATGLASYVLI